jgi:hypothetical protein
MTNPKYAIKNVIRNATNDLTMENSSIPEAMLTKNILTNEKINEINKAFFFILQFIIYQNQ